MLRHAARVYSRYEWGSMGESQAAEGNSHILVDLASPSLAYTSLGPGPGPVVSRVVGELC
jgi:hypothetical protein